MPLIHVTREGPVAVVTLDDGKANVFSEGEFESLINALDDLERSDASALLLRGRPGYFSAGLNLKLLPTLAGPQMEKVLLRFGQAVLKLFLFPRPVVAEVSGHAIGAGAMLAFAADARLLAEGTFKLGLNEVPNGLPVPSYGVEVARACIPVEKQLEWIVHGRMASPQEALAFGVAESLYPPEALHEAALTRAQVLAELPSVPYETTKRNLRSAAAVLAQARLADECSAFASAFTAR